MIRIINILLKKRNSFTHRENPYDCIILNGGKKKFLINHPLYELNQCISVFVWIYFNPEIVFHVKKYGSVRKL